MYNNLNLNISPLNKTVIYCVVLFGKRFTKTDKMGIYPVLNFFLKHCFFFINKWHPFYIYSLFICIIDLLMVFNWCLPYMEIEFKIYQIGA